MKINCQTKINSILLALIFLSIAFGFWGSKLATILTNRLFLSFCFQLLAILIGAILGIPIGLFINSLLEKKKDRKIITSILVFIKTELVSNQKRIENLQHSAEAINSLPNIKKEDVGAFDKFNTILSQESYVAAQSSIAFASMGNDKLMSSIINAYLNIQRIVDGAMALEEIDTTDQVKVLLIFYIKLCERTKESIYLCLAEIDSELKKFNNLIVVLQ